jgi:hypothetical protein
MTAGGWSILETYASGFEADLVIARLEAEDIPAVRDDNDGVGIFGFGFQGGTARGVTVRVPTDALGAARELIRDVDGDVSPFDADAPRESP